MKVQYRDESLEFEDVAEQTVSDLAAKCAEKIGADVERVSLFFLPKPGLLKHPFAGRKLSDFLTPTTRIKLIGTPNAEAKKMADMGAASQRPSRPSSFKPVKANKARDWKKVQEESTYTFHAIEPLPYLPNPEKSRRFLERLANDPGIKASMRKHKFSVGLLTEMNPAEHTTHESRTLGLNRNAGEVIELRLRTDGYDGYRDYKVIRKTLCHELSHNVWGEHDRNFWNLTKEIEQEVERNDTLHGGHRLSSEEFYDPNDTYDDAEHADHGGWTGGDFVLGRSKDGASDEGLSRREIIARAAISRQQKEREARERQETPPSS
ncbi:WLM domain-containing protein [Exophiala viscosa]|uniref:WLM domain-containing protein n=1 Tax=Exophiala viscosa TaxID=2486360 RepID=A0AAN6DY53_9EURO|nr:WLM domain-containing protein [Exophiala viscosa]KAI1624320.1 WLM domain-containing protein [Exophiala viscosa]